MVCVNDKSNPPPGCLPHHNSLCKLPCRTLLWHLPLHQVQPKCDGCCHQPGVGSHANADMTLKHFYYFYSSPAVSSALSYWPPRLGGWWRASTWAPPSWAFPSLCKSPQATQPSIPLSARFCLAGRPGGHDRVQEQCRLPRGQLGLVDLPTPRWNHHLLWSWGGRRLSS